MMMKMTDQELEALGWWWCLRDSEGGLIAVTIDPMDAMNWANRKGYRLIRLNPKD